MASIEFPITFEPSLALAEAATLYERYFQTTTAMPFDEEACNVSYYAWKAQMEKLLGVVTEDHELMVAQIEQGRRHMLRAERQDRKPTALTKDLNWTAM